MRIEILLHRAKSLTALSVFLCVMLLLVIYVPTPDTVNVSPAKKVVIRGTRAADFELTAMPTMGLDTGRDTNIWWLVTIKSKDGFSQKVNLSLTGAPANSNVFFYPDNVTPPASGEVSAFLRLNTTATTASGFATLTIWGKSGGVSHSINRYLTVHTGAFMYVEANPFTRIGCQGGKTDFDLNVVSRNGWSGNVNLFTPYDSSLGATYMYNPTSPFALSSNTIKVVKMNASIPGGATVKDYKLLWSGYGIGPPMINFSAAGEVRIFGANGFGMDSTPRFSSVAPGEATTFDITMQAYGTFSSKVDLTMADPKPKDTTFAFNPGSVTPQTGGRNLTTLTATTSSTTPAGIYAIKVNGTSGAIKTNATMYLWVVNEPDLSIDGSPTEQTVTPGQGAQYKVFVTSLNDFDSNIKLSVESTPAQSTSKLGAASLHLGKNESKWVYLNVTTTGSISLGTYTIRVSAYNTTVYHETDLKLKVVSSLPKDFNVSVEPASIVANNYAAYKYKVNCSSIASFSGPVSLTVGGVPSGTSAAFDASTLNIPAGSKASTNLTISPTKSTQKGAYTLTVYASNTTKSHNAKAMFHLVLSNSAMSLVYNALPQAVEDKPLVQAYDVRNPGGPITWSAFTNASWLAWNPVSHLFSGSPDNTHSGKDYWVRVNITNGTAYDEANLTLHVQNAKPNILTTNKASGMQDLAYWNDYACDDDGQGTITWHLGTNASWLSINAATGNISGTPDKFHVGTYWVNVSVDDGHNGWDHRNFTLTVANVNDPPVWGTLPSVLMTEDVPATNVLLLRDNVSDVDTPIGRLDLAIIATDPAGKLLVTSGHDSSVNVSFAEANFFGDVNVTVSASDGLLSASSWFYIHVAPVNDPPTLTLIAPGNETDLVYGPVNLTWNIAEDPDNTTFDYYVYISQNNAAVSSHATAAKAFTAHSQLYYMAALAPGTYYWSVIPFDGLDIGACLSGIWSFTIIPPIPHATLTFPADKSVVNTARPTLNWTLDYAGTEVVKFDIYIDISDPPTAKVVSNLSALNYTPTKDLLNGTTYYWTVIPRAGGLNGTCLSLSFEFKVVLKTVDPPPVDDDTDDDIKPPPQDNDTDKDGLPDAWEMQYFHNLTYGATDDPDADSFNNLKEYQDNTDPTIYDGTPPPDDDDDDTGGMGLMDYWWIILIIVFVVIILVVLAIIIFMRRKKEEPQPPEQSAIQPEEGDRALFEPKTNAAQPQPAQMPAEQMPAAPQAVQMPPSPDVVTEGDQMLASAGPAQLMGEVQGEEPGIAQRPLLEPAKMDEWNLDEEARPEESLEEPGSTTDKQ